VDWERTAPGARRLLRPVFLNVRCPRATGDDRPGRTTTGADEIHARLEGITAQQAKPIGTKGVSPVGDLSHRALPPDLIVYFGNLDCARGQRGLRLDLTLLNDTGRTTPTTRKTDLNSADPRFVACGRARTSDPRPGATILSLFDYSLPADMPGESFMLDLKRSEGISRTEWVSCTRRLRSTLCDLKNAEESFMQQRRFHPLLQAYPAPA